MFYDINRTHNLDLPYWKYERFDLDHLENDALLRSDVSLRKR